ncbi:hypothetical protein [Methylobacter svalbardensis]|uniref:hypothetical protein n=1 Tax=Methylobacter svalbardensis TaxID=3080016 RepID=UPI0030EC0F18
MPKGSCLKNAKTSDLMMNGKHNLILIGVVDRELCDQRHVAIGEKEPCLDAGDVRVVMRSAREIKSFRREFERC